MRFGPFLVIAILLLLAWGGGFLMFHVASGLIHVLLVLAVLSFIFHFITGRRVDEVLRCVGTSELRT